MKFPVFLIVIAILNSLPSYSQTDNMKVLGKMYTIKGIITNKITKDTLNRVLIELMNKNEKQIKATEIDFDGRFVLSICSNRLISDTLVLKTTDVFLEQEYFYYQIVSDTTLKIGLTMNENKTMSRKKYEEYKEQFIYFGSDCGLVDEEEIEYEMNRAYIHHCSGEVKNYQNLIKDKDRFSEWNLIKE